MEKIFIYFRNWRRQTRNEKVVGKHIRREPCREAGLSKSGDRARSHAERTRRAGAGGLKQKIPDTHGREFKECAQLNFILMTSFPQKEPLPSPVR